MASFYNMEELSQLGLKTFGRNVLISRYARIYNPQNLEIGSNVRIDDFCVISAGIKMIIGNYVHISCYVGIWGNRGIIINDYCNISMGTKILTETDIYDGSVLVGSMFPIQHRKLKGGEMIIHQYVNIGMNCTILPIDEIPEGVAIGANSLVNKPLEAWKIYVGSPVKILRDRSRDMIELSKLL